MAKKLYYKIGEACKILEIQPYVLRYWEKEFPLLSPNKSKSGQRVYNAGELDVIRRIKELLYDEGYTIAGAKKKLEAELADGAATETATADPAASDPAPTGNAAGARTATPGSEARAEAPAGAKRPPAPEAGSAGALERMRTGVEEALGQAREILERLEAAAP